MNARVRILFGICAVVVAAAVVMISLDEKVTPEYETIFHVTLAEPAMYEGGVYTDRLTMEPGVYSLRFTPNGDSPGVLSIGMDGVSLSFYQDYILKGTLHETGISRYHTWEYEGMYQFGVDERQEVRVTIDPNGNLLGAVSVSIVR